MDTIACVDAISKDTVPVNTISMDTIRASAIACLDTIGCVYTISLDAIPVNTITCVDAVSCVVAVRNLLGLHFLGLVPMYLVPVVHLVESGRDSVEYPSKRSCQLQVFARVAGSQYSRADNSQDKRAPRQIARLILCIRRLPSQIPLLA